MDLVLSLVAVEDRMSSFWKNAEVPGTTSFRFDLEALMTHDIFG